MLNNIIDIKSVNPYYIYAPSYSRFSAGIKVLHLLCHHLNLKGYPSFLICNTHKLYRYRTNPDLITPVLDQTTFKLHLSNKKNPIVIYPDIVKGNPLNAGCVVRYLLHYAGFLGGQKLFLENDILFSYTKKISENVSGINPMVLFMPVSDPSIFYPPKGQIERKGSCFYAAKYQTMGGKLFDITKNSIEITRDRIDSQKTEEIAEMFRKFEIFYSYEDTALITEASLCGCKVILIKNDFFSGETLAENELGSYDCCDKDGVYIVRKEPPLNKTTQENFFSSIGNFWVQLENFISTTQQSSLEIGYKKNKITFPKYRVQKPINIGRSIKALFNKFLNK